ncbi:hypothetical protein J437_LFUL010195 [Ladona fulva]|uniref:Peroxidase n=1 Tax=Ladona fulva TaxID=123851 RepID=A0A8K0K9L8_LADFU|nr:hypothetical protein J437_LFUL010195 [Ladona fulva]
MRSNEFFYIITRSVMEMAGFFIASLILGIAFFPSALGVCPFAEKTHTLKAAMLDARDLKIPFCEGDDIPIQLYSTMKFKRAIPESNYTRQIVKRSPPLYEYDVKAAVQRSLHEGHEKRKEVAYHHRKGGVAYSPPGTPEYGHYANFRARDASIGMSEFNEGVVKATQDMQKEYSQRYGMSPHTFMEFLRSHGYSLGDSSGTCRPIPKCSKKSMYYRTYDGSCNNLFHTTWGMAKTPLTRIVNPTYKDAIYEPTVSVTGKELPSAAHVSLVLYQDIHVPDKLWTRSVMLWGQVMAHDMSLAPSIQSDKGPIKCCTPDNAQPLPKAHLHPACLPILVPEHHPYYSKFGVGCLNFANVVTAFLDLSVVYGSSKRLAEELRTFKGGELITIFSKEAGGELLPPSNEKGACDVRVNLHIDLALIQTLFVRWHNELCRGLHKINPHWDDERLYQEARRINIAAYQHISYNEWLPAVLGKGKMTRFGVWRDDEDKFGYVYDYDEKIPPSIINGFTTATFRILHSTAVGFMEMITPDRYILDIKRLSDTYNRPSDLVEKFVFETLLIGMVTQPMEELDEHFSHEKEMRGAEMAGGKCYIFLLIINDIFVFQLTRYLFKFEHPYGMDLESIDVQRQRDHGLGKYNDYRYICGLPKAEKWEDFLDVISEKNVLKLQEIYETWDDVDLIAGLVLENHLKGALVGPTAHCIMIEQFYRVRRGDRFFYSNGEKPNAFTPGLS